MVRSDPSSLPTAKRLLFNSSPENPRSTSLSQASHRIPHASNRARTRNQMAVAALAIFGPFGIPIFVAIVLGSRNASRNSALRSPVISNPPAVPSGGRLSFSASSLRPALPAFLSSPIYSSPISLHASSNARSSSTSVAPALPLFTVGFSFLDARANRSTCSRASSNIDRCASVSGTGRLFGGVGVLPHAIQLATPTCSVTNSSANARSVALCRLRELALRFPSLPNLGAAHGNKPARRALPLADLLSVVWAGSPADWLRHARRNRPSDEFSA